MDLTNATNEGMRELVVAIVNGAVDEAMRGNPWEIEWLGSDDAKYYYEFLDIDFNTAISEFLRKYLDVRLSSNRNKTWNTKKQELKRANQHE